MEKRTNVITSQIGVKDMEPASIQTNWRALKMSLGNLFKKPWVAAYLFFIIQILELIQKPCLSLTVCLSVSIYLFYNNRLRKGF